MLARGLVAPADLHEPDAAPRATLRLAHTERYVAAILDGTLAAAEERRLGFPWSPELRERSSRTAQGTVDAARHALVAGAAANLAGGTHHAFADHGEGFCTFNDVALAIRALHAEALVGRVAIIDLDVHQGNGTASIFGGDPRVFTFSMQGVGNYPFVRERSTLDVELADGTDDATYLATLDRHLDDVLDTARPELVFYLAGADPYRGDRLGRLALSMDGLQRRDRRVIEACARRGLPLVLTLAGGYAELAEIATIHANTVEELRRAYG